MRLMAVVLGAIGIVVAAGNVWAFFIQWLSAAGYSRAADRRDHSGRSVPVALPRAG